MEKELSVNMMTAKDREIAELRSRLERQAAELSRGERGVSGGEATPKS